MADGTYTLTSIATEGGSSAASTGISITVSNGSPSVSIVVPSTGATVSGEPCRARRRRLTRGESGDLRSGSDWLSQCVSSWHLPPIYICAIGAVPTIYGWIGTFDSTQWANGSYPLFTIAAYPSGQGGSGPETMTSIDVDNPAQPAMVVPTNDSTVSGTQVLDCAIPSGAEAPVAFDYTGPGIPPQQLGVATLTYYGWIFEWNTKGGANGQYSVNCNAAYPFGGFGNSPPISITVSN